MWEPVCVLCWRVWQEKTLCEIKATFMLQLNVGYIWLSPSCILHLFMLHHKAFYFLLCIYTLVAIPDHLLCCSFKYWTVLEIPSNVEYVEQGYSTGSLQAASGPSALIVLPVSCWRLMYFYLRSKVVQILGRVTLYLRCLNAVDIPDTLHCVNGRKST